MDRGGILAANHAAAIRSRFLYRQVCWWAPECVDLPARRKQRQRGDGGGINPPGLAQGEII
ncbi:MAG: hypothetical protein HKL95_07355 [Phycisphaerae bacterium]|nr:hypothetical protein [Phycisphaerae bacterium]